MHPRSSLGPFAPPWCSGSFISLRFYTLNVGNIFTHSCFILSASPTSYSFISTPNLRCAIPSDKITHLHFPWVLPVGPPDLCTRYLLLAVSPDHLAPGRAPTEHPKCLGPQLLPSIDSNPRAQAQCALFSSPQPLEEGLPRRGLCLNVCIRMNTARHE